MKQAAACSKQQLQITFTGRVHQALILGPSVKAHGCDLQDALCFLQPSCRRVRYRIRPRNAECLDSPAGMYGAQRQTQQQRSDCCGQDGARSTESSFELDTASFSAPAVWGTPSSSGVQTGTACQSMLAGPSAGRAITTQYEWSLNLVVLNGCHTARWLL